MLLRSVSEPEPPDTSEYITRADAEALIAEQVAHRVESAMQPFRDTAEYVADALHVLSGMTREEGEPE